jgi:LAO/AO transport system kinase
MDAFGFDELILETVGVGQAEYDIVSAADTVIVVLCPGAGDSVQAMKAGLLEVADVLVVNKNDAPGADRLVSDLEDAVALRRESRDGWTTPVVRSSAGRGLGLEDVLAAVEQQRTFLGSAGLAARRRKMRVAQVQRTVGELLVQALWSDGCRVEFIKTALASGRPPYDVADEMRDQIL